MNTFSSSIKQPCQKVSPSADIGNLGWWAAMLLILLATVYRGGNRFVPLLVLEWLALSLLLVLLFERLVLPDSARGKGSIEMGRSIALVYLLSASLWVPALQLLPWPPAWRSPTLAPTETWLSLQAGLPWVACMFLALVASDRQVRRLLLIWVGVGVFQATFGLTQLAFPALLFEPNSGAPVLGTFGNRNGLANFLAMLLPLVVLLLFSGRRPRSGHQAGFWLEAGALLLLVSGLTATLSRAGIATGVLVMALASMLFIVPDGRSGGSKRRAIWLLAPLALVALALLAGGWNWLARFEARGMGDEARMLIHASTWQAVKAFWPLGSGLGTFSVVFPSFATSEMGAHFVNFAHNDYLELLMEAGVLVIPPALALFWLVARKGMQLVGARRRGWGDTDLLAVACGLGVLAQALHAWVDYPWQIPANAMLGAFMLGVFLRAPDGHVRDSAAP